MRLTYLLVFLASLASCAPHTVLAWDSAGFNFRDTEAYVTDQGTETYVLGDTYPTTRGGVTFGWTSALSDGTRNRSDLVDRRLAGVNRVANTTSREFRVDLDSTGSWTICLALGDALFTQSLQYLQLYDDTVLFQTIDDTDGITGGTFNDANGTNHSASSWPGSNTCVTRTFVSTQLYVKLGKGAGAQDSTIAHLSLYKTSIGTTTTTTTLPSSYEICGDGVDNDGSGGDLPCAAPDTDRDGYYSDGTGPLTGTDCDNSNRWIYPGITTGNGCSSGQVHTCQSDGTYTPCIALSAFTCHTCSGSTYWFDDAETDCSGAGSYADPENWLCVSNTGMSGYHSPVAGDCYLMRLGEYATTWSSGTKQFDIYQKNGTEACPIKSMGAPGETWWEAGKGAGVRITGKGSFSPLNEVFPIYVSESSHWETSGIEVSNFGTGFGNAGIHYAGNGSTNEGGRIYNNYVHDIDGEEDNNNSGIKCRSDLTGLEIDHNEVVDVFEREETTGDSAAGGAGWNSQNNSHIRGMDCDEIYIHDNVIYNTSTQAGYGISLKHGIVGAVGATISGNIVQNTYYDGISVDAVSNSVIENNLIHTSANFGISQRDLGTSQGGFSNMTFRNNTVINAACFESFSSQTYDDFGDPTVTFEDNVCIDNRATSYPSDGTDGFVRINYYGSNADFNDFVGVFQNNCYYNSASTTLFFTYYGNTGSGASGADYSGLAAWQAGGFDSGSYNENPTLNSYHIATSANCDDKGWGIASMGGGGPTTTTTTTLPSTRNGWMIYLQ